MEEIKKYTGVLDPLNFKAIRNDLQRKGLLHWPRSSCIPVVSSRRCCIRKRSNGQ